MEPATIPATGKACKTNADGSDVECPDPALGRHGDCQLGKRGTAIDIYGERAAPILPGPDALPGMTRTPEDVRGAAPA